MLIKSLRGWELLEKEVTPKSVFYNRRHFMKMAAVGSLLSSTSVLARNSKNVLPLYPAPLNNKYQIERELTAKKIANTYNNFYEYGSSKNIWRDAQKLRTRPWQISIDGLVEKNITIDIDELILRMPLEERIYRLRCVEGWSMTVAWSGFPMRSFIEMAKPLSSAKYLRMETFEDKDMAPGQRQFWYPWPYVEGLTIQEAANELAFLVTGAYGEELPKQHGAPLRVALPWKYGFKSGKSLVRFTFTEEQPINFWQALQGNEYGFWANVHPGVPHPRWSQATERVLGTGERIPTRIFNGYGEFVSYLYRGMESEKIWF